MSKTTKKEDVKESSKDFSALDSAILALDKRHGKGKIKNEDQLLEQVERWVLESPYLNYITGGGLPKGKMLEFIGPESSGKTSLSEIIAGDVQRQGGFVLFVDLEKAFEKKRALNLGMDLSKDKFLLVDPYTAEESMDMVETLIKSGMIDLVIIDSVAAMSPEVEQNGDFGDSNMGVHARLMSQSCRKLVSLVAAQNTTIIWINQIRMKIGVMFGSPETTPGGKALKFYSSIRLDVRIIEKIFGKDKDDVLGNKIRIKSIKNKTASPFKKAEIFLYFNKGFDVYSQYIDFAIAYKIIDKAGSWYSYKTEKIGQGKEKVKEFLLENPKVFETIKKQVNQLILNKSSQDDDEILNDNVEENNV